MSKSTLSLVFRVFLGLIFLVFGLNGLLPKEFLPTPSMSDGAISFLVSLEKTGYFFPILRVTEVICGLMLLTGYFVPLALAILAPITLQILLFHVFLAPEAGLVMAVIIVILELSLAYMYMNSYSGVLDKKTALDK